MLRVQKVLVPTDFSQAGRSALVRGASFARQFDADLHRVHVLPFTDQVSTYPLGAMPPLQPLLDDMKKIIEMRFVEQAKELGIEGDTTAALDAGPVADQILEYADGNDVDLIVLGTHGHRGFRRFLLGSVASEVVRKARCPVWTCHPDLDSAPATPKTLLVPVDFSEHSEMQIAHAIELAKNYGATVDFLHVVPRVPVPTVYGAGQTIAPVPDVDKANTRADEALAALQQRCEEAGVRARRKVVTDQPAAAIVDAAADSDIVVMASHGLTGLKHALLGSVTDRVVRETATPVLTIHSFGKSWIPDGRLPAAASG